MEKGDFIKLLDTEPYNFLRDNKHLGSNIIYLTVGGSWSYGTNVEGSDVDIRGIALERTCELLGYDEFEQFLDAPTDTTIYGFKKAVSLLSSCNPNMIELLYTKPEHVLYMSKAGKVLRDNRDVFLSKRAAHAFGGYALAQLKRLENSLARDTYTPPEKERHMMFSVINAMRSFGDRYGIVGKIKLHIGKWEGTPETAALMTQNVKRQARQNTWDVPEEQMLVDIDIKGYPLRAVRGMMSEMTNIIADYNTALNHRNRKKDPHALRKHGMHLVRLLETGIDILEGRELETFRPNWESLLDIRYGIVSLKELFARVNTLQEKLACAEEHTHLPEFPDYEKINEMVIDLTREVVINGVH